MLDDSKHLLQDELYQAQIKLKELQNIGSLLFCAVQFDSSCFFFSGYLSVTDRIFLQL